jgi:hypothetical protein
MSLDVQAARPPSFAEIMQSPARERAEARLWHAMKLLQCDGVRDDIISEAAFEIAVVTAVHEATETEGDERLLQLMKTMYVLKRYRDKLNTFVAELEEMFPSHKEA